MTDVVLPPGPDERIGWTSLQALGAGEYVVSRLRSLGLTVQPGNRLERATRLVEGGATATSGALDRTLLGEAHRTIIEQYLIMRCVPWAAEGTLRERLQWLVRGSDALGGPSAALDVQFELFVAAVLALGRVAGVHLAEPDIRIPIGDRFLGIAAKRLVSPSNVRHQVRKALRQICRHPPGLVALNADELVRGHSSEIAAQEISRIVKSARYLPATTRQILQHNNLAGVFGFATVFDWVSTTGAFSGMHVMTHMEAVVASDNEKPGVRAKLGALAANILQSIQSALDEI